MCGIIGYCGYKNAVQILLKGLHQLEYRGYDSSGIAINIKNTICTYKDIGPISNLERIIPLNLKSNLGIGHTRWATHGQVSKENSHPHSSFHNRFTLVHNGTIDNYQDIKAKYLNNYIFKSDTDSEVLLNLIDYYSQDMETLDCLFKIQSSIKGSYAILLIDHQDLDKIYFIKNQTPLILIKGKEEMVLVSDLCNLDKSLDQYYSLSDYECGYITKNEFVIFDMNHHQKEITFIKMNPLDNDSLLDGFSSFMEKEINQEPLIIKKIIDNYVSKDGSSLLSKTIIDKITTAPKIVLVGCGSSYYASKIGQYYFQKYLNYECEAVLSSEVLYDFPKIKKDSVFIFLSQSGETLDVLNLVRRCKNEGYYCICLCNSAHSTLVNMCDEYLPLLAGKEVSVASTKAFLSQSIVLYLLSQCQKKVNISDFAELINNLKVIIAHQDPIIKISHVILKYHDVFFIGRGIDYIIALEGSLKLKEIAYIHAEAFPGGELKHGTLALIDNTNLVISLTSQEKFQTIMATNVKETMARKSNNIIIGISNIDDCKYYLPITSINPDLIVYEELIILQLIAYQTTKIKGNDIDHPRNLAKSVTVE